MFLVDIMSLLKNYRIRQVKVPPPIHTQTHLEKIGRVTIFLTKFLVWKITHRTFFLNEGGGGGGVFQFDEHGKNKVIQSCQVDI